LAECIDAVPVVVHPQRRNGGVCREAGSRANAHTPPKKAEASIAPSRRANTAAPKDRGYDVTSALALAVEAVEALCTLPLRLWPWPDRRRAPIRARCPV